MPLGLGWLKTHKFAWHCSPVAGASVMSKCMVEKWERMRNGVGHVMWREEELKT